MPNPPTPLILRAPHTHQYATPMPIPRLPSTSDTPPLTGTSAATTYLQTPLASAGQYNPSPAQPRPKGFPHNADLLGGPSQTLTPSFDEMDAVSETPSTPTRVARVRERLATRRAERAVETLTHQRSHSRHIFDAQPVVGPSLAELSRQAFESGRIAIPPPFRLPEEYVPTPASLSFGFDRSPGGSITLPTDVHPENPFRFFGDVPPPRPNAESAWMDDANTASPLVDMWNHSIQQTVDRRLPLEPQRDARMAPHLGEGYAHRLDHGATSRWAEGQAAFGHDERRRLASVAGPGGGEMWGDVPIDPVDDFARPPSHPYLRHRDRVLEMDGTPPPYRTFTGNMAWYDYDAIEARPYLPYSHPQTPDMLFRDGQSAEDQKAIVRMITKGVQRLPMSSRKKAAESMVKQIVGKDCEETVCAVCHDEYETDSRISVTPCKHMYHKDCLDVWLDQPLISSCPMCRRDLATLACVERMLKKGKEAALKLWMSV